MTAQLIVTCAFEVEKLAHATHLCLLAHFYCSQGV